AAEPGGLLVRHRVVLHRAAAQRVEVLADREVHRSQPAVVAHDLGLAEAGKAGRGPAEQVLGQRSGGGSSPGVRGGQSRARRARTALLEAQRLGHDRDASAATSSTSASMAAASFTSVQQYVTTSSRSGYQRPIQ